MRGSFHHKHMCDTCTTPANSRVVGGRATDPIWSLKVYNIQKVVTKPETPAVYYLFDEPKRGFVREELMVVPPGTVLPPVDYLH